MNFRLRISTLTLLLLLTCANAADDRKVHSSRKERDVLYFMLDFCSVLLIGALVMTVVFVGIEINCPLLIPKPIVWISDLAREAHEKYDMEQYFKKKLIEDEISLRQHNLLSANDTCLDNCKDQYFKVAGIGTFKYESQLTRYELLLKHYERKLKKQRKRDKKARRGFLL